jgi:hypothetical protein
MRTTVEIEPDLAAKLRRAASERRVSFTEALNAALRAGLQERGTPAAPPYRLKARRMKLREGIDLDSALRVATLMEDNKSIRQLRVGGARSRPKATR